MTAAADGYSHARHMAQVQASAREEGIKGAAYSVLSYLCSVADFRKPIARASKDKIERRTGYCYKTIKAALATLRAAGFIEPVAFATGGRGLCPVYVLRTKKGGENLPPLEAQDLAKGGKKFPEKGGKNFQKRGEKTSPPSDISSSISSRGEKGSASRAGWTGRTLDAGASPGPRPATDRTPEEQAQFLADLRTMTYGEALDRERQRKRQVEGILP